MQNSCKHTFVSTTSYVEEEGAGMLKHMVTEMICNKCLMLISVNAIREKLQEYLESEIPPDDDDDDDY